MRHSEAQCIAADAKRPRKRANQFNRVSGRGGKGLRGLRERNGDSYAQMRVSGRQARLRLEHAQTVPQAVEPMQVLKRQKRDGTLKVPRWKTPHTNPDGAQGGTENPSAVRN